MATDKVINDNGGSTTRLVGCFVYMMAVGGSLFGESKEILAMCGCMLGDVVMRPAQICLWEKDDIRIYGIHVFKTELIFK